MRRDPQDRRVPVIDRDAFHAPCIDLELNSKLHGGQGFASREAISADQSRDTTFDAPEETGAQPGMQALQRGLRILNLVASRDDPVRFPTLREASSLPKGTLHRILHTLIDERYLDLDERSQTYSLGSKPFQLPHRVWDQFDLRGAAEPERERLADLTGEAVCLGIIDGDALLCIDQRDTPRQVRPSNDTGARSAIHATASGKAMVAHFAGV